MASTPVGSNALIQAVLDRSNYKKWRLRLKTYLLSEDLWDVEALEQECKVLQGYDENADHLVCYKSFIGYVRRGDWDKAKKCLGEVDALGLDIQLTCDFAPSVYLQVCMQASMSLRSVRILVLYLQAAAFLRLIASMDSVQVGSNTLNLEILNRNNYKKWRLRSCGAEMFPFVSETESATTEQECKVLQGFDENNSNHLERYKSFVRYVVSGDWDKAKECLAEVDVRSVVVRAVDGLDGAITLHVAAWEGHAHIVKDLVHLMTQEYLKTKTDSGHHTAFHMAAQKGHVHVVKELPVLLMGEVQDMDGDTALHIAVQVGKVDVVKELVLLMRQEDLKIKNDAGYTALHLAVNKGDMPMVKEFVGQKKKVRIIIARTTLSDIYLLLHVLQMVIGTRQMSVLESLIMMGKNIPPYLEEKSIVSCPSIYNEASCYFIASIVGAACIC
ncbi:hypothetical protein ACLB2K_050926 [Fragaria x ananassa]